MTFNIKIIEGRGLHESCVGYCPVIEASPTELPTVYTILQRSQQMADQLGQRDVIIVFDQAIYARNSMAKSPAISACGP